MKVNRRRFLTMAAAFAATPARARQHGWTGRAFGADVSLTVHGPGEIAEPMLREARRLIAEVEHLFSLYDPASDLVRLNRHGRLVPDARFHALMQAADRAHRVTGGLFDPTVQPLWRALAEGGDPEAAKAMIGWDRVRFDAAEITLGTGQALTFNGIAQGFATDLVAEALVARGATRTLVNIGEYRGTAGPWRLGLQDPTHGLLATRALHDGAIATSSPMATPLGEVGHILHRSARPLWSTVSVEAATATVADACSTALVFAPMGQVRAVKAAAGLHRITLVDWQGDLVTL